MQNSTGPHFVRGGFRYGTSPYGQGTNGDYFSSSADTSATFAYGLRLNGNSSTVYPANYSEKPRGIPLRCLAQ